MFDPSILSGLYLIAEFVDVSEFLEFRLHLLHLQELLVDFILVVLSIVENLDPLRLLHQVRLVSLLRHVLEPDGQLLVLTLEIVKSFGLSLGLFLQVCGYRLLLCEFISQIEVLLLQCVYSFDH